MVVFKQKMFFAIMRTIQKKVGEHIG